MTEGNNKDPGRPQAQPSCRGSLGPATIRSHPPGAWRSPVGVRIEAKGKSKLEGLVGWP